MPNILEYHYIVIYILKKQTKENKMFLNKKYETISPSEAKKRIDSGEDVVILDVRTPAEYAQRHIKGSVLLPVDELRDKAESLLKDKSKPLFVYCLSGARSSQASSVLSSFGYTKVYNLGGIMNWPYETE